MIGKPVYAYGFSWRKRTYLKNFLGEIPVCFIRDVRKLTQGDQILLWGNAPAPTGLPAGVKVTRVEDGFLRSVGLGADLARPISWVFDSQGIYYDAGQPSDLEYMLQTQHFDEYILTRAARLRQRIIDAGLNKYNVGNIPWYRPETELKVILIVGQVESDASIKTGAPGINTNIGLLQAVRKNNPNSYLIYKPHPDVMAGLRARGIGEDNAREYCNELIGDVSINALIEQADEVHVLTSLAGFEALIRGKPVICYGQPFYSGWGLTEDRIPNPRRTRKLKIDELVAGALICYPRYVSLVTGTLITSEQALDELIAWREKSPKQVTFWTKLVRIALRRLVGVQ